MARNKARVYRPVRVFNDNLNEKSYCHVDRYVGRSCIGVMSRNRTISLCASKKLPIPKGADLDRAGIVRIKAGLPGKQRGVKHKNVKEWRKNADPFVQQRMEEHMVKFLVGVRKDIVLWVYYCTYNDLMPHGELGGLMVELNRVLPGIMDAKEWARERNTEYDRKISASTGKNWVQPHIDTRIAWMYIKRLQDRA
jgi:hypothetical protein